MESGFFLDSDVKIVGKSIRDRVALIKWRRERTVPAGDGEPAVKTSRKTQQNLLQVPTMGVPQGAPLAPAEPEEPEADQHTLICIVPTNTTSATCEYLQPLNPLHTDTQTNTKRQTEGQILNYRSIHTY